MYQSFFGSFNAELIQFDKDFQSIHKYGFVYTQFKCQKQFYFK